MQRVNVSTAAKLTGRAEKTIRAWLAEDPPPLSVEWGAFRGGRRMGKRMIKGRTRLLDVDELKALHLARGGTEWNEEYLPASQTPALASMEAEMQQLRADVQELRGRLERLEHGEHRERRGSNMQDASPHLAFPPPRAGLPEGSVLARYFAQMHHVPVTTVLSQLAHHSELDTPISVASGRQEHWLTPAKQYALVALWQQQGTRFLPCPSCPHQYH